MKAVIKVGGKQFIVAEKEVLLVDKLESGAKSLNVEPLMVFDDKTTKVGAPIVKGASVKLDIVEDDVKAKKVVIGKFQAKKRVKNITGHRQHHTKVKVASITV